MSGPRIPRTLALSLAAALTTLMILGIDALARPDDASTTALAGARSTTASTAA